MPFCIQCGNKLDDGSNFCGKCGAKVNTTFIPASVTTQTANYSMYEVFDISDSTKAKVSNAYRGYAKMFDFFGTYDKNQTAYKFIITDKSIIINNTEYLYNNNMSVIYPIGDFKKEDFVKRRCKINFDPVDVIINNVTYTLKYSLEQEERFLFAAVRANEHINLPNIVDKVQSILTMYAYLYVAEDIIKNSSYAKFNSEIEFKELNIHNKRATITSIEEAGEEGQHLISNYTYVQNKLNEYFKQTNIISNENNNREPSFLAALSHELYSYSGMNVNDLTKIAENYRKDLEFRQQEWEEYERCRAEEACYKNSNSNGGFLSHTISTAAGVVIGNKIYDKSKKKQERK